MCVVYYCVFVVILCVEVNCVVNVSVVCDKFVVVIVGGGFWGCVCVYFC